MILGITKEKPSSSSEMNEAPEASSEAAPEGSKGSAPELSAKQHAAKKFFQSAQSGKWDKASVALQQFIDICNYEEDEEDDGDFFNPPSK